MSRVAFAMGEVDKLRSVILISSHKIALAWTEFELRRVSRGQSLQSASSCREHAPAPARLVRELCCRSPTPAVGDARDLSPPKPFKLHDLTSCRARLTSCHRTERNCPRKVSTHTETPLRRRERERESMLFKRETEHLCLRPLIHGMRRDLGHNVQNVDVFQVKSSVVTVTSDSARKCV